MIFQPCKAAECKIVNIFTILKKKKEKERISQLQHVDLQLVKYFAILQDERCPCNNKALLYFLYCFVHA